MVNTTNKAAKRLREHLIDKCFETGIGFRVFVNSGESGKATFTNLIENAHRTKWCQVVLRSC